MKSLLNCILMLFAMHAAAQVPAPAEIVKKKYATRPMSNQTIEFDGVLNDPVWNTVEWGGDFTEYQPDENTPPSHPSQFKILYDEKYLYIATRAYDSAPDSIVKRMSRRTSDSGTCFC
ncbi:MAG: hypothetical protein HUU01_21225 [Saprospiraceae bacterium]|nr:hypothetical protein [Saprospiraceae bacterium]